jgi:hypothetical protein
LLAVLFLIHAVLGLQKSFHYLTLLKAVFKNASTTLKSADVKEVAASMTVIAIEKLKVEKEATAGKKKTGAFVVCVVFSKYRVFESFTNYKWFKGSIILVEHLPTRCQD